MKRSTPWQPWAIIIGVLLILLSGSLLSEGMETTGLRNAYVAQSLTEGYSSFWVPTLNIPVPDTHNYMPLGYWMQALFIKMFGNSLLGDKLYSILIFLLCGIVIDLIWHALGSGTKTDWVPLVFWIMCPVIPWSATNNPLEGPLAFFVLLSIYAYIMGLIASMPGPWERGKIKHYPQQHMGDEYHLNRFLFTVLAAFLAGLAFMVKGFSGVIVFFLPFCFWLFSSDRKNLTFFVDQLVILGTWLLIGMFIAILSPDAHRVTSEYVEAQLAGGLATEQNVTSHLHILFTLIAQMAIATVVVIIVVILLIKEKHIGTYLRYWGHKDDLTPDEIRNMRFFYIFFALGSLGMIPIMVSLKQHPHYLLTIIPCYALSFGFLVQERVEKWMDAIHGKGLVFTNVLGIALLMLGLLLNLSSLTKITVDQELITDLKHIIPELEEGEVVSVTPEMLEDESTAFYFYRYKSILLDTAEHHKHLITMYPDISRMPCAELYELMQLPVETYHIYRLKEEATPADELPEAPPAEASVEETESVEAPVERVETLGATTDPRVRANSKALFPDGRQSVSAPTNTEQTPNNPTPNTNSSTANTQNTQTAAPKQTQTQQPAKTSPPAKKYKEEKYMVGY